MKQREIRFVLALVKTMMSSTRRVFAIDQRELKHIFKQWQRVSELTTQNLEGNLSHGEFLNLILDISIIDHHLHDWFEEKLMGVLVDNKDAIEYLETFTQAVDDLKNIFLDMIEKGD